MGVCLYTIITLTISDTFRILDFMNYPIPTRHDTQSPCEIPYRFGSTDCRDAVPFPDYRIEVNSSRDNLVRILEANRPETRRDT